MRTLAVVPARGGSKGIADKNLRHLAGRPLLAYTADAATGAGDILNRIVLSTDSAEIAELGRAVGLEVPFLRPPELALDTTPMHPVIAHAVDQLERSGWKADVVVVLQPTAPLRRAEHIRAALELLERTGCSSVASVVPIPQHYSPEYAMRIDGERLVRYLPDAPARQRRQDAKPAYSRDGTVYALRREVLDGGDLYGDDCRPLVLDPSESVNLDTPGDWQEAEARLSS